MWLVKPEYSLEWIIMTKEQLSSFLNWTKYKCEVKPKCPREDSGVEG